MKTNRRIPSIKLNDQAAMDYALYMMMSSFFKKVESLSPIFEEQLLLRYRTQSAKSQEVMENMCVGAVDHYLPLVLPPLFYRNISKTARYRQAFEEAMRMVLRHLSLTEASSPLNSLRKSMVRVEL